MTGYKKLYEGMSKAAWGYFFLYVNINLGTVSILPTFVGYIMLLNTIKLLQDEDRELALLWKLGDILATWYFVVWLASWVGVNLDGAWPVVEIIVSVVKLYFHFQLLTNLASIVERYQLDGSRYHEKLLVYRTVQTVLLTANMIITKLYPWFSQIANFVSVVLVLINFIVCICLMSLLFKIRKHFGNSLKSSAKHFENS